MFNRIHASIMIESIQDFFALHLNRGLLYVLLLPLAASPPPVVCLAPVRGDVLFVLKIMLGNSGRLMLYNFEFCTILPC